MINKFFELLFLKLDRKLTLSVAAQAIDHIDSALNKITFEESLELEWYGDAVLTQDDCEDFETILLKAFNEYWEDRLNTLIIVTSRDFNSKVSKTLLETSDSFVIHLERLKIDKASENGCIFWVLGISSYLMKDLINSNEELQKSLNLAILQDYFV